MRMSRVAVLGIMLGLATQGFAKEPGSQFKTVETKHFTRAEGLELPAEFTDYLYAELRAELAKAKIFGQVIGEGEVVDAADVPTSIVIEGTITEYKKGNAVKDRLIGFTSGWRSLRVDTTIKQRGDQKVIVSPKIHVRSSLHIKDKILAKKAAQDIVEQIKEALKNSGKAS
jgi:hypothetical protein